MTLGRKVFAGQDAQSTGHKGKDYRCEWSGLFSDLYTPLCILDLFNSVTSVSVPQKILLGFYLKLHSIYRLRGIDIFKVLRVCQRAWYFSVFVHGFVFH